MCTCRSRSAWTSPRVRRCWPPHASTSASCRSARSDAARRTSWSARDRIVREGKLGHDRPRRDLLLLPDADPREPARHARRRRISTTRCGPARRRCGPTTGWCTRAGGAPSWNTATASSATCASTCSTRCAGCSTSAGRRASARPAASSWTRPARRTSPTRRRPRSTFPGLRVVWTHRTYGDPPDPKYPWGMTFYGDKGTLKASVMSYDFVPHGDGTPVHEDVVYELEQFPEDKTEKDLERHVAPAIRAHMQDLLHAIEHARHAGRGHRAGLHVHRRLHPGEHLDAAWPLAAVGSRARAGGRATTRPTGCSAGPTARPGSTRSRRRSESSFSPRPFSRPDRACRLTPKAKLVFRRRFRFETRDCCNNLVACASRS